MRKLKIDIESLIKEFGIDKLPEEKQSAIMADLLDAIHIRVGLRMGEVISNEDAKKIEALSEDGGEEALKEIERIYPDFRKVYQEEVDNVREEMRGLKTAAGQHFPDLK